MSEQEQAPFLAGQTVKHKGGETGTVIRCEKRTAIGSVRWVVDITRPGQGRNAQWWASNCELVSDRPEWPKYFESAKTRGRKFRRIFDGPIGFGRWADGSGKVGQTYDQSVEAVSGGALVEVDENGVEIVKQEPEEKAPGVTFEVAKSADLERAELQTKIDELSEELSQAEAELVRLNSSFSERVDKLEQERDAARASASNRGRIIAAARTILSVVGLGFANDSDAATLEAVRTLVRKFVAAEARGDIVRKIIERNS